MHVRKSGKSVHFRLCHHLVEALVDLNTAPAHNSGGLRNRVHEEDSAFSQSVIAGNPQRALEMARNGQS